MAERLFDFYSGHIVLLYVLMSGINTLINYYKIITTVIKCIKFQLSNFNIFTKK